MALQVGRGNPTYQPFPQGGTLLPFQPVPTNGLPPGTQTADPTNPTWSTLNGQFDRQPNSGATGGGGLPPWVSPDQAQFYQTLNAGWKQGHGGQDIPMERFQYLQNSYNSEAAQGANGSHVGDLGWWQNRAAIDRGPDPGEPGYTGDGSYSGGGGFGGGSGGGFGGGGLPPGYSTTGANRLASFSAPGLAAPWTEQFNAPPDFVAPTEDEVMNSAAVKARLKTGEEGLQRSAAAKGTLLTGGTLKDLANYDQGVASQEYDNEYNRRFALNNNTYGRRLGEYQMDEGTFFNNSNNAYNKLAGFTQLGMQGAGQLGGFGTGYSNSAQNNANATGGLLTGQANANANASLANANNTNSTLGGLAESAGAVDWSKAFKRQPGRGGTPY